MGGEDKERMRESPALDARPVSAMAFGWRAHGATWSRAREREEEAPRKCQRSPTLAYRDCAYMHTDNQ